MPDYKQDQKQDQKAEQIQQEGDSNTTEQSQTNMQQGERMDQSKGEGEDKKLLINTERSEDGEKIEGKDGEKDGDGSKEGENSVGKEGDEQRWSLTALWNATRPISLRILAVATSARLIRPNEPLNPVTALFEPATVISGKSLIMMSIKSKMDIEELKRCRANSGKKKIKYVYMFLLFRCTYPESYCFLCYISPHSFAHPIPFNQIS